MSNIYKIIVEPGRNLLDIAMQEYGSIDGLLKLCNDNNLRVGEQIQAGTELIINSNSVISKKQKVNYSNKGIIVATGTIKTITESNWILADGTWNDLKIWIDEETWRDN